MFDVLQQSTDTCLVARFSSKVTGAEYQQFLDAVNVRLGTGQEINLVLELIGFEFFGDFAAAKDDFKFGFGEYKQVRRAALVGDQKWLTWFGRLIGPLTRTEEKIFPSDQIDAALAWACT